MRKLANVSVVVIVLLICGGLLTMWISRVRECAMRQECKSNLRLIGMGLNNYAVFHVTFPRGTVANEALDPEKRLSWYLEAWGYVGDGQIELLLDKTKAWDCEENLSVMGRGTGEEKAFTLNLRDYRCPANSSPMDPHLPSPTHYVGISGVGLSAAIRPDGYPQIGVFGYDRATRILEITRGTSTVMMVCETACDTGPWTAGGPPTVRGLDTDSAPYLGLNGQFSGMHRYPFGWILSSPYATNVLFVDGSVRSFTDSLDPRLFEAMATIAGHDVIERLGDE
jgi:prepilin-type processing-associated H-X9-DG protein